MRYVLRWETDVESWSAKLFSDSLISTCLSWGLLKNCARVIKYFIDGKLQPTLNCCEVYFSWPVSFWPNMPHRFPDMPIITSAGEIRNNIYERHIPDMNYLDTILDFLWQILYTVEW